MKWNYSSATLPRCRTRCAQELSFLAPYEQRTQSALARQMTVVISYRRPISKVLLPRTRRPRVNVVSHRTQQISEGLCQLAEGTALGMGGGHGELSAKRWLMRSFQVALVSMHSCFQCLLGAAWRFGVRMKRGVGSDTVNSSKRLDCGQEPRLVFPVRQDDFARHTARRRASPQMHLRTQLRGAIPVAIEHDEYCVAAWLTQCQTDGLLKLGLLNQLAAWTPDRSSDADLPSLCVFRETPQEYRQGGYVAVAFHDRLDVHERDESRAEGLRLDLPRTVQQPSKHSIS